MNGFRHLAIFLVAFSAAVAQPEVKVTKRTLNISGAALTVEIFEQQTVADGPVILVLHGAGGMLLDGPEMRRVSRHLAGAGDTVYLLHYFEGTGTLFATDTTMQRNFSRWLGLVRDSITAIQKERPGARPIGIYGYSLGAFLALAAASDNPQVGAVVEHAGGVWNGKTDRIGQMPAVLMIHGRRDGRVPFEKYAVPLTSLLRKRGGEVETRFFPSEGHGFTPAAMAETRETAARFFRRKLKSRNRL